MSLNTAVNAMIALIEERTDLAKELFRGPTSDIQSIPEVMNRLQRAIDLSMAKGIRKALVDTLKIQPYEEPNISQETFQTGISAIWREAFFAGVAAAEQHFDIVATDLEHNYHDKD